MSNAWTEGEWEVHLSQREHGEVVTILTVQKTGFIQLFEKFCDGESSPETQASAEVAALAPRMAAAIQAYAMEKETYIRELYDLAAELDAINKKYGSAE
jgi:hypothetical protein